MKHVMFAAVLAAAPAFAQSIDISKGFDAGGQSSNKINLDLGTKRVNWTNARWAVMTPEKPLDLSQAKGVRISVSTDQPRSDVGVYLALKDANNCWYYVQYAVDLTQKDNTGVVYFDDFTTADYVNPPGGGYTDPNGRFDPNSIGAIAVGTINPLGVGKVSFTVNSIEAVPADKKPTPTVNATVSGKLVDINNTTMVPAGLFGAFNLKNMDDGKQRVTHYRLAQDRRINPGSPTHGDAVTNIMINTIGDRTATSPRLNNPKWREDAVAQGTRYGEAAKSAGKKVYVEWWNEPYLNWANINRKNFDPALFDDSKAAEGGPVTLKHDGTVMPFMKWTKQWPVPSWNWTENLQQWRRGKDEKGTWSLPYAMPYMKWSPPRWRQESARLNPPDTVKDGEKYKVSSTDAKTGKVTEREFEAFTPWHIYDETQFTYWSGKGMAIAYNDPMLAFGKAFKDAAGDAKTVYIAGWGNRPSEDHWAGFAQLYKDTIDLGIQYIDGVCDHDYGGDPRKMPANYEFITAYGVTKHNKWLTSWNTETAMGGDTQAYGDATVAAGAQFDQAKFNWLATKLLHALVTVPDKARSFSWFGIGGGWFSDTGEGQALLLLNNLRGQLLHVDNSDPEVYVVAAVDGTDPENPRPANMPQRKELVVAVMNDAKSPRAMNLNITAPAGTKFDQVITRKADMTPEGIKLTEKTDAASGAYAFKATLQPKEITVLTFPLTGEIAGAATVTQRQFFSKDLLVEVTPEKPSTQKIDIAADTLNGAGKAWITFAAERLSHEEGTLVLNGKEYVMPPAVTPENAAFVRRLPLNVADLKASNTLVFKAKDKTEGYLLPTASIVVEK